MFWSLFGWIDLNSHRPGNLDDLLVRRACTWLFGDSTYATSPHGLTYQRRLNIVSMERNTVSLSDTMMYREDAFA